MSKLRFGILTVSDRSASGERPDASGPALQTAIESHGWLVVDAGLLPDELDLLREQLMQWCDSGNFDESPPFVSIVFAGSPIA